MNIPRASYAVLALALSAALWSAYGVYAAPASTTEKDTAKTLTDSSAPPSGKLNVAKIDGARAAAGFKKGQNVQQRGLALGRELEAARKAGDQAKTTQITQQMEQLRTGAQSVMMDALKAVVQERKIDMVVGVHQGRDGQPVLGVIYRAPDVDCPDITDDVISRINVLAETRPALDSQPASAPSAAARPGVLTLQTRPALQIQPPATKK